MKLKGKPRETIELPLRAGVTATVAYLTRLDQRNIAEQSMSARWDSDAKQPVQEFDFERNLQERLRIQVPAVSGLTESALVELAEITDDAEPIDVPDPINGEIPWIHDHVVCRRTLEIPAPTAKDPNRKRTRSVAYTLPMYLYTFAPKAAFAQRIDEMQDHFEEMRSESEKKSETTADC